MRRFSQRNSLVTLSDINITPLLDLAFVLLIIFVITTPLLEQTIPLDLPDGGVMNQAPSKDDLRLVEVSPNGFYLLGARRMTLDQMEAQLVNDFRVNPRLTVRVRADRKEPFGRVSDVLDRCMRNGIRRVSYATNPPK